MYRNEHAARVVALTQKTASINLDIQKLTLDMQWYDAFDCEHASAQLAQRNRITLDIKQRLNQLSATLQSTSQSKQACQGVAGGWLSGLWRSTEQKVAQHQASELDKRLAMLELSRKEAQAELASHEPEERRLAANLRRYRQFNPLEATATITGLNEELAHLHQLIEHTRSASEKWEAMAGDVSRQWER